MCIVYFRAVKSEFGMVRKFKLALPCRMRGDRMVW